MDDQSFELLMSKLDGLEAGQTRIEESLGKRLDDGQAFFRAQVGCRTASPLGVSRARRLLW